MAKPFSLGRGLSSLIPKRNVAPVPVFPAEGGAPVARSSVPDLGRIHEVPIGNIKPNARQPRHHFDHAELESLVQSIREHGIIQPLVARSLPDGSFELIAGERRLRASQMLGLTSVPVIVRDVKDDRDKLLVALVENLNRSDLNAMEEAQSYAILSDEFGLTQDEIARRVGKARPTIANMVRLLKLPADMQRAVIMGIISTAQAKVLAGIEEHAAQQKLFSAMLGGGVTVRVAEEAARGQKKGTALPNAQAVADAETLRRALGTKVTITGAGQKGAVKIAYFSSEEYRELLRKLGAR
jgi:ParB family chromosome partitioning protein